MTASLRQRVLAASERIVGAPERTHLLSLLRGADGYRLDFAAAREVALALRETPAGVERNLDLARLSGRGTWIEYPDAARRVDGVPPVPGTRYPHDVGVLVTVDPTEEDRFVVMAAWDFEDGTAGEGVRAAASVRHSYACVAFSRSDLSLHAYAARVGRAGPDEEAPLRMLGLAHAYVPGGFADEMSVTLDAYGDGEAEEAEEAAMRDAVSEASYGLAALLFLSSRGAVRGAAGPDARPVALRRPAFPALARLVGRQGFVRSGKPANPRLGFSPLRDQRAAAIR